MITLTSKFYEVELDGNEIRVSQGSHAKVLEFSEGVFCNLIDGCQLGLVLCLEYASANGYLEVVKFLVEKGCDIHARDEYALRWASYYGHIEVVKYLCEKGCDIHARDEGALRWASYYGHIEIVKYLCELGADIHAEDEYALRWASYYGHIEIVKYLKSYV